MCSGECIEKAFLNGSLTEVDKESVLFLSTPSFILQMLPQIEYTCAHETYSDTGPQNIHRLTQQWATLLGAVLEKNELQGLALLPKGLISPLQVHNTVRTVCWKEIFSNQLHKH